MRKFHVLLVFLIWIGCSVDEETISTDPTLEVIFSSDTISFDTLLTDTRSSTRRLKVLNPNSEAVQFSAISLGLGDNSDYSVIINGQKSTRLVNQTLFGGDSLLILVEVNVVPRNENLPYIVKDSVIFEWNTNKTHVKLIAYGQDGNRRSNGVICDETWTNARPYIISDTLVVGENCQLTLEKGTKVYFENDAALFIQGRLVAIGDSSEHILFRNARFDGAYNDVPGQWNGIYFLQGSTNNQLTFAEIFNAQVGLRVGTPDEDHVPDLTVSETIIYNMSLAGILAFTSDIEVTNSLIYNCGMYLVGNFAGGNYTYTHCTLSSEPSIFVLDEPTVQFSDNIVLNDNEILAEDLSVQIVNSIIWGSGEEELLVNRGGEKNISLDLESNIIKSVEDYEGNYTSQEFNFPGFKNPLLFDYRLDTLAFAKDIGLPSQVIVDITGTKRDENPDIGSYERIEH